MLRDVFYYGSKPNVHPREKFAKSLMDARTQASTEHFWIINEHCDYRSFDWDFDFELLPDEDVWAENHNNVWPSQHQKDSGTWLCPKKHSDIIIYRNDVDVVKRKNLISNNWKLLEKIDTTKFDFSWHPDPTDPPYIYAWGCKFFPVEFYPCLEYHAIGATEYKYMDNIVELLPNLECIVEYQEIDKDKFDLSWRPDPMDPPYIYVWGNKYIPAEIQPTLEYHVPGATEKKYMHEILHVLPEISKWEIPDNIDTTDFDLSWRPDPREPDYIWQFGTQWQKTGGPKYKSISSNEIKYVDTQFAYHLPHHESFVILEDIDESSFDFSWHPDSNEPPYIYVWGNKYVPAEIEPTLEYHTPGATERKYMGNVDVLPETDRWIEYQQIDKTKFDLSWRPPSQPAYIYTWGNKYVPAEIKPTLEYHSPGATERKYMGDVEVVPEVDRWTEYLPIDKTKFDLTWRPDPREPAYIYVWGNQWNNATIETTITYTVPGATECKYMPEIAYIKPSKKNYIINVPIDENLFDFTWRPDPTSPPYIYVWGNRYVPGELKSTIEYHTAGATEIRYMPELVEVLPEYDRWIEHQIIDKTKFDLSWRPDPREPAYIYTWGNKYVPAEIKPTLEYHTPGASERKYMGDIEVLPDLSKWVEHQQIDKTKFDLSWRPDPREPAYIYTWGNKYVPAEIKPTLEYHTPGASERKYMGDVDVLPELDRWKIYEPITHDFDLSWRPDPREPAYIYVWGNKYVPGELKSTLEYHCSGATEKKYMGNVDVLPQMKKWNIVQNIDKTKFDLTWRPDPREPAYIYVWGNKHIAGEIKPTLEYHVEGATERKYMPELIEVLPELNWKIYQDIDKTKFDLTWRPDPREPAYIYTWGNKYIPGELKPTLEYYCEGATEKKYMTELVEVLPEFERYKTIQKVKDFDYTWRPDPREPAYIYTWGNKYVPAEIKPTLEYHCDNAIERKYMGDLEIEPELEKYKIYSDVENFDFAWRPDPREPAYIYTWGNKYVPAEIKPTLEYYCDGATERKYMGIVDVKPEYNKWVIHQKNFFDLTWRPDPREPAYIYTWGNKYVPAEIKPTLEYYCDGAVERKYMGEVEVGIEHDKWKIYHQITNFDLSWRPDPREPAYIYIWGNKYVPAEIEPTLEYHTPGATERKYMGNVDVLPQVEKWRMYFPVDEQQFDMAWRPDPREPAYIYTWGNKYVPAEIEPTLEYHTPGATERKYMGNADILPLWKNYKIHTGVKDFDFTWMPDPREPAYIYTWGNKYVPAEIEPTLEFVVDGAIDRKYMGNVEVHPQSDRWVEHQQIDKTKFDLSWRPDPREPAYIYTWGNKYVPAEVEPTLEYHTPGATERKYMGNVDVLPETDRWIEYQQIDKTKFDLSWRPPSQPAYIYTWGNKYVPAEIKPTLEYHSPGATERKYMGDVEVVPELSKWVEHQQIDKTKFDLSWRPDPREPAYIYVWGNKYIPGVLKPTLEYHAPNATEYKYMHDPVEVLPEYDRWVEVQKVKNFDYTWRPDPREPAYIYVWGNQWIPGELKSTIEYHCPGATEKKYLGIVEVEPEYDRYVINLPIDKESFDFTWRPDPREPAYIYVWGNQSNSAEIEPTVEYHCIGATEKKYMNDRRAKTVPNIENWKILIPVEDFDYSWRPDPHSPPYIYVFGNQWHDAMTEPTLEYHVPNATDKKYVTDVVARVSKTHECWKTLIPIDSFDYSWRPNPHSPPYIYVFGNQWNESVIEPTVEYHQPNAIDYKYVTDIVAIAKSTSTENNWKKLIPIDSFDYSWRPDPKSPPYIYVFGNKWNSAATEPSIEYWVEGATDRKYMDYPVAIPKSQLNLWSINNMNDLATFDFTWRPNPHSPPQIYQWEDNGPRYVMPGAKEVVLMKRSKDTKKAVVNKYYIKTTLEDLIGQHPEEVFWALNPDLNYEKFDFTWRPDEINFRHINVFGNQYSKNTQTYFINAPLYMMGYKEYNYVETQIVETETKLSMFYIDRGNKESEERFKKLKILYPNIQKTRYFNNWVETISRCIKKTKSKLFWVLNSELDYSDFKFDFYPSPWQQKMIHVFGTQWSHWGTTYLINSETFNEDSKYVKVIEHLNNLNFIKGKKAKATNCLYDVYLIDHGNYESVDVIYEISEKIGSKKLHTIDFAENYYTTFKKILNKLQGKNDKFIWVCNSICHYDNFEFNYICDPFAVNQLHVFPSDKQKYGDTFLVNIEMLQKFIYDIPLLEEFVDINYNNHQTVTRISPPEFISEDTHVKCLEQKFQFPYAIFKTKDNKKSKVKDSEPISLWSDNSQNILVTSTGGTRIIVPKRAQRYIKKELYDYPFIKKAQNLIQSEPLDIVFLSNGEINADENYEHLLTLTKNLPNKVVRVDGVNGRVQAYHAVANASNTPWVFTVFAKLRVNEDFDFSWQPDRLQIAKHYVFTATNPVNDLEYGHQAMIAYNKNLVLNNTGQGLDFTLDDPHEIVNISSGIAMFDTDEYSTWRTAFREAIKLHSDTTVESCERLEKWLNVGIGPYGAYSIKGASDGIKYYEEVNGDFDKLKLSYEWEWLKDRYKHDNP